MSSLEKVAVVSLFVEAALGIVFGIDSCRDVLRLVYVTLKCVVSLLLWWWWRGREGRLHLAVGEIECLEMVALLLNPTNFICIMD